MKRFWLFTLSLILLCFFCVTAYAAQRVPSSVLKSAKSVVRVVAEYSNGDLFSGTGFVVQNNKNGTYIATNYHVVEGQPTGVFVWVSEDERVPVTVEAYAVQYDCCVLYSPESLPFKTLSIRPNHAKQGDLAYVVGFPGASDYLSDTEAHVSSDVTITDGIISAIRSLSIVENGVHVTILQTNADINPGNSGGPLFDEKGNVVGINTYGAEDSQGVFGAIEIGEFAAFIEGYNVDLTLKENGFPVWLYMVVAVLLLIAMGAGLICVKAKKKASKKEQIQSVSRDEAPSETKEVRLKKKRTPRKKHIWTTKQVVAIVCVGVIIVLCGGYVAAYRIAVHYAEQRDFTNAGNALIFPDIVKLFDKDFPAYVNAGVALENGDFDEAQRIFGKLGTYRNAKICIMQQDMHRVFVI